MICFNYDLYLPQVRIVSENIQKPLHRYVDKHDPKLVRSDFDFTDVFDKVDTSQQHALDIRYIYLEIVDEFVVEGIFCDCVEALGDDVAVNVIDQVEPRA